MPRIDVPRTIVDNHLQVEVLKLLLTMLEDARRHGSPETYEVRVIEDSIDLLQAYLAKHYDTDDPNIVL